MHTLHTSFEHAACGALVRAAAWLHVGFAPGVVRAMASRQRTVAARQAGNPAGDKAAGLRKPLRIAH